MSGSVQGVSVCFLADDCIHSEVDQRCQVDAFEACESFDSGDVNGTWYARYNLREDSFYDSVAINLEKLMDGNMKMSVSFSVCVFVMQSVCV